MKLYLLSRPPETVQWDENSGFVIAAPSLELARELAKKESGDEGLDVWDHCLWQEIGIAHKHIKQGVILTNFNAG